MPTPDTEFSPAADLVRFAGGRRFATVLADPPWQFINRTGKVAPEHRRLSRYDTHDARRDHARCRSPAIVEPTAHLYLWVPNALLPDGLAVMPALGLRLQVQHRLAQAAQGRRLGRARRRLLLPQRHRADAVRRPRQERPHARRPAAARSTHLGTRKREHSRKPDEQYDLIEACSPGPYLELFGRGGRPGWTIWGNQADDGYRPTWTTYRHNSTVAAG